MRADLLIFAFLKSGPEHHGDCTGSWADWLLPILGGLLLAAGDPAQVPWYSLW